MTKALKDTFSDFGSALSVDQDAFAKAFQFNMGEDEMKSFMSELMGGRTCLCRRQPCRVRILRKG